MSSFLNVPYNDILNFLSDKNQPFGSTIDETYLNAWNYILINSAEGCPTSIIDFIISLNISKEGIFLSQCRSSFILNSLDDELFELASLLRLNNIDKERMIRILGFLGKLDNDISVFTKIPKEIFFLIISQIDRTTISSLHLVSRQFNNFCQSNEYKKLLIDGISKIYDLDFSEYTLSDLRHIYLMGKEKYLYPTNDYSMIINMKGQVYTFGRDFINIPTLILGLFNIKEIQTANKYIIFLDNNGSIRTCSTYNLCTKLIPGANNIIQICNNIIIDNQGYYYCIGLNNAFKYKNCDKRIIVGLFGLNNKGQIIETGKQFSDFIFISISDFDLLDNRGNVYHICKDNNGEFELEIIPNLSNIIQISSSNAYSLALDNKGKVYLFSHYRNIEVLDVDNIVEIATKNNTAFLLDSYGRVYSWGNNEYGKLGLGHNNERIYSPTLIPNFNINF